jgi:hypothetical protein
LESVPFVAVEDFGTTGLTGDTLQWQRVEGERNPFFAFFRAEGENAKSADNQRGRWGIGKFVFPRSSRISTFLGWTCTAEPFASHLLGRCILKSHAVEGVSFVPDGYFGQPVALDGGRIAAPVSDEDTVRSFREHFRLTRTRESGLSVVVPWPDRSIDTESVRNAVLSDWFHSLVTGELVVELRYPEGVERLDAETVFAAAAQLPEHIRRSVSSRLELSKASLAPAGSVLELGEPNSAGALKWNEAMVGEELRRRITEQLAGGNPVVLRVPLFVRRKDEHPEMVRSFISVVLAPDETDELLRPVYLREGIVVSDVRGRKVRGVRSLVVATDRPVATLLGDAENPAHTEWRPDTANFKDRYTYGPSVLSFVRDAPEKIMAAVRASERDEAPNLLVDFFSVPEVTPEQPLERPTPRDRRAGEDDPSPVVIPPAKPQRYRLFRVNGGFRLSAGDPQAPPPTEIRVRVAYDVRSGNPFKKYRTDDFRMFYDELKLSESSGAMLVAVNDNVATWRVTARDFSIEVTGFDVDRDLIVDVTALGGVDATQD